MSETRKVFKWWWGWNPEKIETWLEDQEAKGWNLARINTLGTVFTFKKGTPRRMAYRIDFQPQARADYRQLFEDDQWEMISEGNGWYYWGREYRNRKPEIFTDTESLIGRNGRQAWFLTIIWLVQFPGILMVARRLSLTPSLFIKILLSVQGLLFVILSVILIQYILANRQLKKKIQ